MKKSKLHSNHISFTIVATAFLVMYSIIILLPLIWALYSSFKTPLDFLFNPAWFPSKEFGGWNPENYLTAIKILYIPIDSLDGGTRNVYFLEMFINSILYTVGCVAISLLSHICTAYIASRYKSRVSRMLYIMVIVVMTLPIVGSLPSEVQMTRLLGLYDNIVGIWLLKGGFASMYFLILYAAFKNIPNDFAEAASIDGAGHFKTMLKVILPMVKNTIIAIMLLMTIAYWNDYTTPGIFMPSKPTVAFGMYRFQYTFTKFNTVPVRLAASLILSMPVLMLFLIFRNKILGAVMMGGLKG